MEPVVRLIPLGGLGEIGLNMMLIESGEDLLAIDCGLMFPDDELPGIDHVIPDFSYALARREAFRAVVLTHGHEDHIGALPYLLREIPVPVYGTPLTLALVTERLREHGLAETADLRVIRPRDRFETGGGTCSAVRAGAGCAPEMRVHEIDRASACHGSSLPATRADRTREHIVQPAPKSHEMPA